ncbi:hypothetical protein [Desulfogranum mediterraneum]|uniref:hypothetical protein n=1 Tax=Desulfogranum mediterraneum TaxID=160661 RepID=UPI000411BA80|nr:hypothetical protein [Desulfogranum mediterraneum]
MNAQANKKVTTGIILTLSAMVLIWVTAAFIGALNQVDWQVGELMRQYMVATGMMNPIHTLVDYYSHIKGIEYLICVAFFVAFPVFVKYINHEKKPVPVQR